MSEEDKVLKIAVVDKRQEKDGKEEAKLPEETTLSSLDPAKSPLVDLNDRRITITFNVANPDPSNFKLNAEGFDAPITLSAGLDKNGNPVLFSALPNPPIIRSLIRSALLQALMAVENQESQEQALNATRAYSQSQVGLRHPNQMNHLNNHGKRRPN